MREIKFRAWDNNTGKWYEPIYEAYAGRVEDLLIKTDGHMLIRHINGATHDSMFPGRFILEQYTGLNDENGREIYEGDIVALDEIWGDQRYGVIQYNPYEGFGIIYREGGCKRFLNMHYFYELGNCEMRVVCSKHENPELVEEI